MAAAVAGNGTGRDARKRASAAPPPIAMNGNVDYHLLVARNNGCCTKVPKVRHPVTLGLVVGYGSSRASGFGEGRYARDRGPLGGLDAGCLRAALVPFVALCPGSARPRGGDSRRRIPARRRGLLGGETRSGAERALSVASFVVRIVIGYIILENIVVPGFQTGRLRWIISRRCSVDFWFLLFVNDVGIPQARMPVFRAS